MSWLINISDYANATVDFSLQCKSPQGVAIWSFFTAISYVFGIPGAVVILLDMCQKRRKGTQLTPNDVFILNLAVMDGVFLLFLQRELYQFFYGKNLVYEALISFLYSFNLCGRPLFITCICLDCYLAVVHPVTYHARKSLTPRVLMAVGVWTVTILYGCYSAFVHDEALINDLTPVCFFAWTLPVIGYCDLSMLWTLKRSSPGGRDIHPQKKKAMQIIINNLVVSCISYVPPIISLAMSKFLNLDETTLRCLVMIPVMHVTVFGNIVSIFLHLNNLGKLDWLKCRKLK